jgi:NAD(P)-dependent dehydrogenase (short-subunit alcohol dehydrogenase family)
MGYTSRENNSNKGGGGWVDVEKFDVRVETGITRKPSQKHASVSEGGRERQAQLTVLVWIQDMGLEADCKRVVQDATSAFNGLDIIISNAVRTPPPPPPPFLPLSHSPP